MLEVKAWLLPYRMIIERTIYDYFKGVMKKK